MRERILFYAVQKIIGEDNFFTQNFTQIARFFTSITYCCIIMLLDYILLRDVDYLYNGIYGKGIKQNEALIMGMICLYLKYILCVINHTIKLGCTVLCDMLGNAQHLCTEQMTAQRYLEDITLLYLIGCSRDPAVYLDSLGVAGLVCNRSPLYDARNL